MVLCGLHAINTSGMEQKLYSVLVASAVLQCHCEELMMEKLLISDGIYTAKTLSTIQKEGKTR